MLALLKPESILPSKGAALRMKLVKNTSPLDGFLRLYFDRFLTA